MKRCFDIFFAVVLIIFLFLPMVFIAIMVKFTSKGPIFFWSRRVGRDNVLFDMPKFRTMNTSTPITATHLLLNPDDFVTPIGSFLRQYSLDEFPQLWPIIKGEMSLVGPRPALFNQKDLIALRVKKNVDKLIPGVTGLAQVYGRDSLTISEKVNLDYEYSKTMSIFLDIKILFITFFRVFSKSGISH
jgi:O-antigen biosynthesis protein WbqP